MKWRIGVVTCWYLLLVSQSRDAEWRGSRVIFLESNFRHSHVVKIGAISVSYTTPYHKISSGLACEILKQYSQFYDQSNEFNTIRSLNRYWQRLIGCLSYDAIRNASKSWEIAGHFGLFYVCSIIPVFNTYDEQYAHKYIATCCTIYHPTVAFLINCTHDLAGYVIPTDTQRSLAC